MLVVPFRGQKRKTKTVVVPLRVYDLKKPLTAGT